LIPNKIHKIYNNLLINARLIPEILVLPVMEITFFSAPSCSPSALDILISAAWTASEYLWTWFRISAFIVKRLPFS